MHSPNPRLSDDIAENHDRDPIEAPTSYAQESLWLIDQLEGPNPAYNESITLQCTRRLSGGALRGMLSSIVSRHEALRTTFAQDPEGHVIQRIWPSSRFEWRETELSEESDLRDHIVANARTPFDLSHGPLVRGHCYHRENESPTLQIVVHHIVLDGWSRRILVTELEHECLTRSGSNRHQNLPTVRYRDFVHYDKERLAGARGEVLASFWEQQLADLPDFVPLPYDKTRPPAQSFNGGSASLLLSPSFKAELLATGKESRSTLFPILLAAFAATISRYSGTKDICVGVPVANRPRPEDENCIGHFVNTVVLRNDVKLEEPFSEFLSEVRSKIVDVLEHGEFPFSKVVERLQPNRSLAFGPLFQIGFEYHRSFGQSSKSAHPNFVEFPHTTGTSKYDLTLYIADSDDGLHCTLEFATDLFEQATAERLLRSFEALLIGIIADHQTPVGRLPLMSEGDRRLVLVDWNKTARAFPPVQSIYEYFAKRSFEYPEAVAVQSGELTLTYSELQTQVENFAKQLHELGVRPGSRVCLSLNRSWEMIAAVLAILRSGAAYVPIDPNSPARRAVKLIGDSSAAAVITDRKGSFTVAETGIPTLVVGQDGPLASIATDVPPSAPHRPEDPAYVIFTSGSTGVPKGVIISHGNALNTLHDIAARYPVKEGDRYLFNLNYTFDASVIELFSWFVGRGSLVILPPGAESSPDILADVLVRERISHVIIPTALLAPFVDEIGRDTAFHAGHSLKYVYVGGAALSASVAKAAKSALAPAMVENHYGPTEAAVLTTTHTVSGDEVLATVPIGKPISNTKAFILNDMMEPAPIGVPDELYIGGAGVASGYMNRPQLNAERFISDPWVPGTKLYRTGDYCRWLADGRLHYLGRTDSQVKIRGMRVELGEIEQSLLASELVRDVAIVTETESDGEVRLVAYVVPKNAVELLASESEQLDLRNKLIEFLEESLPAHMVPKAFGFRHRLPLTQSGKTDRHMLAAETPILRAAHGNAGGTPATDREATLVQIWSGLLRRSVGVHDNFFEVGGDSILAIQVASRARRAGFRFSARDVFRFQTIAELSTQSFAPDVQARRELEPSGDQQLLPIQYRFFEWSLANVHEFDQSVLVDTPSAFDKDFLEEWLRAIVRRHEAFRTRFKRTDDGWCALTGDLAELARYYGIDVIDVSPTSRPGPLSRDDLTNALETARRKLNIEDGPILNAALLRSPHVNGSRLLLTCHHLAVDGVSWRILLDELRLAYDQWSHGESFDLDIEPTSIRTWAEALQHSSLQMLHEQKAFWTQQLNASAGSHRQSSTATRRAERKVKRETIHFESAKTGSLIAASEGRQSPKLQELLLTAVLWALGDAGWKGDVTFALEGHGREPDALAPSVSATIDLSQTIGWFTSYYPVSFPIPDAALTSIEGVLTLVREKMRQIPGRGVGYDVLRFIRHDDDLRSLERAAQPAVLFNFFGSLDDGSETFRRVEATELLAADHHAPVHHAVELNSFLQNGRLSIRTALSDDHAKSGRARKFIKSLMQAIDHVAAYCESRVAQLQDVDWSLAPVNEQFVRELRQKYPLLKSVYPTNGLQRGLIFHSMLQRETAAYTNQLYFQTDLNFDKDLFKAAWKTIISRHELLRSAFVGFELEAPLQIVVKSVEPEFKFVDLSHLPASEEEAEFVLLRAEERQAAFDFSVPPLMRFLFVRCSSNRYRFLWTCHHAILDGWSVSLLWRELVAAYDDLKSSRTPLFDEPPRYANWVEHQLNQDSDAARRFWERELAGFSRASKKSSHPDTRAHGENVRRRFELSASTTKRLADVCRRYRITLGTVLQAIWALNLHVHGHGSDLVFGTTVSGRTVDVDDVDRMVGLLINTVPARFKINPEDDLEDWLKGVQRAYIEREAHSFLDLIEIQRTAGISGRDQLFETILVVENYPENIFAGDADPESLRCHFDESTHYDLALVATPGVRMTFDIEYNTLKFSKEEVAEMGETIRRIASAIAETETDTTLEVVLERQSTGGQSDDYSFENGYSAYRRQGELPLGRSIIHELIEDWALKTPSNTAVVCNEKRYSYVELNQAANRLAHFILDNRSDLKADDCIAVSLPRDDRLLIAILAIWKVGATYVPLDPALPGQRLQSMLASCGARTLISGSKVGPILGPVGIIDIDAALRSNPQKDHNPEINVSSNDLAYVLFTSGSTGTPKGAMVEHVGALNNIINKTRDFNVTSSSNVAQTASQSFDISIWQMFIALTQGGRTTIYDDKHIKDVPQMLRQIAKDGVTVLEVVPTYLMLLTEQLERWDGKVPEIAVDFLVLTGETADAKFIEKWRQCYPDTVVANAYGPTEASDDITHHIIPPGTEVQNPIPIGKTLANFDIYIVDEQLRPVGLEQKGEIVVTGVGVGRGYVNMPSETELVFLKSPFPDRYKSRLYKTGDLGSMQPDGSILFLGRKDKQVKIRGYRIEIEEIELHLAACAGVRQAVVLDKRAEGQEAVLSAFVVAHKDRTSAEIAADLSVRLPAYMVPSEIHLLDSMPELINGKVDRLALRSMTMSRATDHIVEPRSPVEVRLAQIWSDVLGIAQVSIHSSFFDLGGDSFKAIRVAAQYGPPLEVADIYDRETIAAIAEHLEVAQHRQGRVVVPVAGRIEDAEVLVVGIANSGGDPISFRHLGKALSDLRANIALQAVKLPRIPVGNDEEVLAEIERLSGEVAGEIMQTSDLPIIVLAQCNGSALGVSLTRRLKALGADVRSLVVGSALMRSEISPPDIRSDREILEFLKGIGSTLPEDPAEIAFFLHDFRYDSRFANVYYNKLLREADSQHPGALDVELTCVAGTADPLVAGYQTDHKSWLQIAKQVRLEEYRGQGHYLLRDCPELFAKTITTTWLRLRTRDRKGAVT